LNESAENKKKLKPLIQTIKKHGLEDAHECLAGNDKLYTWKNGDNSSRIDYIFMSEGILENTISHEILDIEDFDTDHRALTIKFELKENLELDKKEYFRKTIAKSRMIK
ncbi:hypothetical protein RhiirB3_452540, partial [Rhizophagus irregularis]